jgi:hypothetical protein
MKILESASLGGGYAPTSRKRRVLFFIAGPVPTEAELAAAEQLGTKMFRNAAQVTKDDAVEKCDAVAGAVPPSYAKLPRVEVPAVAVAPAPETPANTQSEAPADPAPAAPAPVTIESQPVTQGEQPVTPEEVKAFSSNSIDSIVGMVKRGEVSRDRAVELERQGKNRKTLIQRLTEAVD